MKLILSCLCLFFSLNVYGLYKIPAEDLAEFEILKQATIDHPESPTAHFELAMNYAYTGRVLYGWESLKKVNELAPSYSKQVIAYYTDKVAEDPTDWHHYFKLAFGYYFDDQKDKAEAQFYKILELDKHNFWAMAYIGLLEGDKKNYKETIKWCKKALSYNNDLIAVHWLIGKAYEKRGKKFAATMHRWRMMSLLAEDKMFQPK